MLKGLVAIVVLAFMAVVVVLASQGSIAWGAFFGGLIPDFSALFKPTASYNEAIAATGENASFWTKYIADSQRNIIIGAFGSAVGINMTFLLPYTLLKRGWSKQHRELSRFDLVLGLFVPFLMATSFLVIATSAQFHAKKDSIVSTGNYNAVVDTWLASKDASYDKNAESAQAQRDALPDADQQLAAMVAKRTAKDLAKSLEPALGKNAQLIFGIGILAMAISTMIVHMMMNGYAISEAFGKPGQKALFMFGAAMPALSGFFSPILWTGNPDIKTTLNIPAGTIATTLLPIAYLIFILLMNSRQTLGEEMPRKRSLINILMLIAGGAASFAAVWNLIGRYGSKDPFMHNFGMIGLIACPPYCITGLARFRPQKQSQLTAHHHVLRTQTRRESPQKAGLYLCSGLFHAYLPTVFCRATDACLECALFSEPTSGSASPCQRPSVCRQAFKRSRQALSARTSLDPLRGQRAATSVATATRPPALPEPRRRSPPRAKRYTHCFCQRTLSAPRRAASSILLGVPTP